MRQVESNLASFASSDLAAKGLSSAVDYPCEDYWKYTRHDSCVTTRGVIELFDVQTRRVIGSATLVTKVVVIPNAFSNSINLNNLYFGLYDPVGAARQGFNIGILQICGRCKETDQGQNFKLAGSQGSTAGGGFYFGAQLGATGSVVTLNGLRNLVDLYPNDPRAVNGATLRFRPPDVRCDNLRINKFFEVPEGCVMSQYRSTLSAGKSGAYPQVRDHVNSALKKGYPSVLKRATAVEKKLNSRGKSRLCSPMRKNHPGEDCDEFPFASAKEGCSGNATTIRPPCSVKFIDRSQNRGAGAVLGYFLRYNRLLTGESYEVVP